jgi:polar amino acid transport system substrate-binding protein
MKKTPALLSIAAAALLALTGCTQSSGTAATSTNCTPEWEFDTVNQGVLTIASVGSLPYLDIKSGSTEEAGGIDGDFYTEFAKRACLKANFTSLGGPAAVAALTQGQADVGAGGWYATPERAKSIGQTEPVWYNYTGIASSTGLKTVDELKGKKVGVVGGSVYVEPLSAAVSADSVGQYQTADAMLQDLKAGRIAAGLGTAAELSAQVKERNLDFTVYPLAADPNYLALTNVGNVNLPHSKSNTALTEALNAYVKDIRANGTVKKVLEKYGITDPTYYDKPAS